MFLSKSAQIVASYVLTRYSTSMLLYLQMLLSFLIAVLLAVITITDFKTRTIPDILNLSLFLCGISVACLTPEVPVTDRLIGSVCVSVPLLLLTMVLPEAFGGGDIKLMAAAGFLLGWESTITAACIGIVLAGIYGSSLLITGKKTARDHFAFGPALCVGIAIALFLTPSGTL
ncbi:MAG TPA: hypothetical protein DEB24_02450 [Coriobacteriia bacterium]|nr:hypothetical protein [Coriobacteriia bacterium]